MNFNFRPRFTVLGVLYKLFSKINDALSSATVDARAGNLKFERRDSGFARKMSGTAERSPLMESNLPGSTRLAYALGHIFNDLAAAMWFSYTLIYLQRVALLAPITAGALMLLGQVVDALMTPVFGILVDRYNKKKMWHVIGTAMVTISFPVIFGGFADTKTNTAMVLYMISITIFQIGWAAVQISHLSMIPLLAKSLLSRADLTAIRYTAQVTAAIVVFIVTWIVLPTNEEFVIELGKQDDYKFRNIVVVLTSFGLTASVLFHILLKARLLDGYPTSKLDSEESTRLFGEQQEPQEQSSRLNTGMLLRVAMLYVASRLFITLTTVYLPLYTEEADVGGKQALATVPLVSYLASFMASLFLKYINRSCGSKMCYLLGALIGIASAIFMEYAGYNAVVVYVVAILIGAGSSITMVTSLSITAEIIGPRTERSALVYSIVTFLDKVVTGVVVILIEKWRCHEKELCPTYNRDTLSLVSVSSMILGLVALMSITRCVIS